MNYPKYLLIALIVFDLLFYLVASVFSAVQYYLAMMG